MKKKLVAFAVTAAMVITSAVPALAWTAGTGSTLDTTQNQLVLTSSTATRSGITETGVAGAIANGKTFSATVDLNRTSGDFEYVLGLSNGGKADTDRLVRLWFKADGNGNGSFDVFDGDWAHNTKSVKGIVDITWTFTVNSAGTWVDIVIDERGKTPTQGTADIEYQASVYSDTVDYLKLNAWDGDTATNRAATDYAPIPAGSQVVVYQNAEQAPVAVESVTVVEAERTATGFSPVIKHGLPVVADQPVKGGIYYVYSITLDDGTVIDDDDLDKYVTVEWTAVKDNGTPVTTTGITGEVAGETNRYFAMDRMSDPTKYDGCFITATVKAKADTGIFGSAVWGADADALAVQYRLAGENRYETAMLVADEMKPAGGFEKFVVATGTDYADSLSATSLAKELKAPILLVNSAYEATVAEYIEDNAATYGAEVYVVGGTKAVSADFENLLKKFRNLDVVRLSGDTRYDTNIEVLKKYAEVKPGTLWEDMAEVLVASGKNYPDALSAAATGKPVLLVGDTLTTAQRIYLSEELVVREGNEKQWYQVGKYTVIGGRAAVNDDVKAELSSKAYIADAAKVTRLGGLNRYTTNAIVMNAFVDVTNDKYVFVASGNDYADALTGGVLAAQTATNGCAMVLVNDNNTDPAKDIVEKVKAASKGIYGGLAVIGGENAVSNATVQKIA